MSELQRKRKKNDYSSSSPAPPAKRASMGGVSISPAFSLSSMSPPKRTPNSIDLLSSLLSPRSSSEKPPAVAVVPKSITMKEIQDVPTAYLSIPKKSVCHPLEDKLLLQDGMTAEKLLQAMVECPMQSIIVTSMSASSVATNLYRLQDKLGYVVSRDQQLTENLAEKVEERIPLEQKRLRLLAELERAQREYNEIKEEVEVLDTVMAAEKSDIMEYRVASNHLGILLQVLRKLKDTPLNERPFGKLSGLSIEQIRVRVGCPTPQSCFELSYVECVAINFVFLTFGYATHPTLTGLWEITPNGNKRAWVEMYGDTPLIKTRKAGLVEMQQRIHDYLAFVFSPDSPIHLDAASDIKGIPMNVLAILSAEYERRMKQTDTKQDEQDEHASQQGNCSDEQDDEGASEGGHATEGGRTD